MQTVLKDSFLNTGRVFAALMSGGALGPACAKARSPSDVVVLGMMRSPTAADHKRTIIHDVSLMHPYGARGKYVYVWGRIRMGKNTYREEYTWGRIRKGKNTHGEEYVWGRMRIGKNTYGKEYAWGRIRMWENMCTNYLTSHIPVAVVGFRDVTLKLLVDDHYCGRIIGREGKGIKKIRDDTGARISISK